ncbi:MAG: SUMF1/EgtB/PvdO family nonheme iron enzyme [Bacteroidetes bacterium]|nr:SUMF1/EgtB/PvdO family nonheme iron enzyme [Bacteroidota bacterium]
MKKTILSSVAGFAIISLVACSGGADKSQSGSTGWKYNNKDWGGFEAVNYKGQPTGPGLVFVEGGRVTLGSSEFDATYERNNFERTVTIPSFYMDETEVRNIDYREYLYWLNRVFGSDNPLVFLKNLPDTLCWRDKLAYNEPMVKYYFRHPAYDNYPVVGVNWIQAASFADWRGDRVNEAILINQGYIKANPKNEQASENFNTEAYLAGQVSHLKKQRQKPDLSPTASKGGKRDIKIEDGVFLPEYRLPTEAEWEYAAYAYRSQSFNENIDNKKIYPWQGLTTRNTYTDRDKGRFMDNFKRGRGDNAGVSGRLNDGGFITCKVKPETSKDKQSIFPNDFGLYHMGANVAEWVMDVYRPMSLEDFTDFNSFRGNVYQTKLLNTDGEIEEKDSLGRIRYREVTAAENVNRRNYKVADNIGFKDELNYQGGDQGYEYSVNSLINNKVRVYKGGSWNDRAYWMAPGTRRWLDEEQSLAWLGFRCAMIRVGEVTLK